MLELKWCVKQEINWWAFSNWGSQKNLDKVGVTRDPELIGSLADSKTILSLSPNPMGQSEGVAYLVSPLFMVNLKGVTEWERHFMFSKTIVNLK